MMKNIIVFSSYVLISFFLLFSCKQKKTETEIPKDSGIQVSTLFNNPEGGRDERYKLIDTLNSMISHSVSGGNVYAGIYSFSESNTGKSVINRLKSAADSGVNIKAVMDKYGEHNYTGKCCVWEKLEDKCKAASSGGSEDCNSDKICECNNYYAFNELNDYSGISITRCEGSNGGQACISNRQGIQHVKYFLFDTLQYGDIKYNYVVYVSSGNLTYSGTGRQYNNAVITFNNKEWFDNWVSYFNNQFKEVKDDNYYENGGQFSDDDLGWSASFSPAKNADIWGDIINRIPTSGNDGSKLYINQGLWSKSRVSLIDKLDDVDIGSIQVISSDPDQEVIDKLDDNNIPYKIFKKPVPNIDDVAYYVSHHKYIIYYGLLDDSKEADYYVWTGSNNFTRAANYSNDEVILGMNDEAVYNSFLEGFESMWKSISPN